MTQLTINPKFRDVARPLRKDEFELLEANILKDGRLLQPIITWNGTIVDGHNRWAVLQKHPEIHCETKEMEFADDWAVIAWICNNQLGRRNLTNEEREFLISQEYEAQKMTIKNPNGRNQYTEEVKRQNDAKPQLKTSKVIAERHGIGSRSVERAVQFGKGIGIAESLAPGAKESILSGKTGVPKSVVAEIPKMDPEQQMEVARKLQSGEKWERKTTPRKQNQPEESESTAQFDELEENDETDHTAQSELPEDGELEDDTPKVEEEEFDFNKLPRKERYAMITATMEEMRDQDREIVRTLDTLLELLTLEGDAYIRRVRRQLQAYSTTLDTKEARKKVVEVLNKTESDLKKQKGLLL